MAARRPDNERPGNPPHGPIHKQSRGKLPLWERDGGTYFMTFRLTDSLPTNFRAVIEAERRDIMATASHLGRELSESELKPLDRLHSEKIEELLHAGYGECHLRDDRCAEVVANALAHFDGKRYLLHAWCVMPNHLHVMFTAASGHGLSGFMHSWKPFTANQCNRLLGRRGPFWMDKGFDRLIRDGAEFEGRVQYTLENPVKAGLKEWKWVGRREGSPFRRLEGQ